LDFDRESYLASKEQLLCEKKRIEQQIADIERNAPRLEPFTKWIETASNMAETRKTACKK